MFLSDLFALLLENKYLASFVLDSNNDLSNHSANLGITTVNNRFVASVISYKILKRVAFVYYFTLLCTILSASNLSKGENASGDNGTTLDLVSSGLSNLYK